MLWTGNIFHVWSSSPILSQYSLFKPPEIVLCSAFYSHLPLCATLWDLVYLLHQWFINSSIIYKMGATNTVTASKRRSGITNPSPQSRSLNASSLKVAKSTSSRKRRSEEQPGQSKRKKVTSTMEIIDLTGDDPSAATLPPPSKKQKKAAPEERRARRFRRAPPQTYLEKLARATTQR